MPSPSHSPLFDDVLLCPVCMVFFEGRILQCSQGHAVCEACQLKLTECPTCRGVYVGTRNYILEAVIAKLKLLHTNDNINIRDSDDEQRGEIKSTNEAPENALVSEAAQSDAATSESATSVKISAPKGVYDCRMSNCDAKLPFCRLLNHMRYFHKDSLIETTRTTNLNEDGDFIDHWSLPCATFQKCFHLHNFGIFFLIVNVTTVDGTTFIKAWVQCAYPNRTARNFRFTLELLMGNHVATFTDYVVGAQSDSDYIQSNNNCLNFRTEEHYDNVTIEMKISRTLGPQNLPRNERTHSSILPVNSLSNSQQNQPPLNEVNRQNRNRPAPR